ncbi:MAG: hypothetical protein U0K15_08260 [Dialister sp.]|nr:hypothetical protein [Dialister sp.]
MNKRLGEVRASEGNQGILARMARGQSKYGQQGIKNQYQSILSWEASHERMLFCAEAGCSSSPVLINALLAAEEPLLWINKREIG